MTTPPPPTAASAAAAAEALVAHREKRAELSASGASAQDLIAENDAELRRLVIAAVNAGFPRTSIPVAAGITHTTVRTILNQAEADARNAHARAFDAQWEAACARLRAAGVAWSRAGWDRDGHYVRLGLTECEALADLLDGADQ